MKLGEIASFIPFTLADLLVAGGFVAAMSGSWLTFGAGPTLMIGGGALVWVGGVMYRASQGSS